MTIERITISVPAEVAAKIRRAAGSKPVSAWVTDAIEAQLEDEELERLWKEFYADVAPRAADKRRARAIMSRLVKKRRRTAA